uniref:Uncharacterized protein n=1 Tax=Macaca fascicularis TaxID=9541 RepID=A0A7N9CNI6_MACFA
LCWRPQLCLLLPMQILKKVLLCFIKSSGSRVRVHNVQVCYICIHVPYWCAAPINSSYPIKLSFVSL